ncbi:hypothetical protein [Paenibacillus ferrarius]|uniref:hypothetical protein n=1 Tax=Paenibacillus ferrarius TaxID=1469647 RepID=UPI001301B9C3|nr:hypothetical protein [Paenibacillus ferrarius]
MKNNKYEVILVGYISIQTAGTEYEAIILAQAEAIKEGLNYRLVSAREIEYQDCR